MKNSSLTKPALTKTAAALRYRRHQDKAPCLAAKGRGAAAEKILHLARENDIPILKSPLLARMLQKGELEQPVPENLFQAVAEIYAFIMRIDEQYEIKAD
ncbi:MAG: EscU/YscU/HrcU family type III secretion system export apparatus switch protein [Calditrichia bacterium]